MVNFLIGTNSAFSLKLSHRSLLISLKAFRQSFLLTAFELQQEPIGTATKHVVNQLNSQTLRKDQVSILISANKVYIQVLLQNITVKQFSNEHHNRSRDS